MAIIITNDFPPDHGGIQRCMYRIAHELTLGGRAAVIVIAPYADGCEAFDAQQAFRVVRFPARSRLIGFVSMVGLLLWAQVLTTERYILASSWLPAGLAACCVPRPLRGRLGVIAHGTEIAPGRGGLRRHLMRWVFKQAQTVIANSRFTRGLLLQAGVSGEIAVIRLGVDARPIAPARAAVPTIVCVGRLIARKGFDTLITALPRVLARAPSLRCEIIGNGPQLAELRAIAQRLGVADQVAFRGSVDDDAVARALAAAWYFALPVRRIGDDVEGFGLVYLEAALADLPAIGGRESGAEDAIVAGETGLLVDGRSSDEVADAIIWLLDHPAAATAMGQRGRERALADFGWQRTAAELATLMRSDRRRAAPRWIETRT